MVTDPMPPCPFRKNGHKLSVIIPETSDLPATLFCDACGATKAIGLKFPTPVDDLMAEAIAELSKP